MIVFNNQYMMFDPRIEPYQRADDVGYAISEFLWFEGRPFYSASALAKAKVAQVNLCASSSREDSQDNCDLIFQMPKADGGHFFEIVMRSDTGTTYGGWVWGESLECLDQFVNGYRVIRTSFRGTYARFEYSGQCQRYGSTRALKNLKTTCQIDRNAQQASIED